MKIIWVSYLVFSAVISQAISQGGDKVKFCVGERRLGVFGGEVGR